MVLALRNLLLCLSALILIMGTAQAQDLNEKPDTDPAYAPIENMFLLFPMLEKDFWNWSSAGSAVFLENKAVIAPEASNRKGLIHTTQPNPKSDHWYAVLDFNIGREKVKELNKSGDGLGIYYLRNFDSGNPDMNQNFYGFMDDFDGVGIFVNTLQTEKPKDKTDKRKLVSVSSFANDGKRMLKQNSPDKTCYRELTGKHLHFSKIAIEYEKPMLSVSVFDHEIQQFTHCFSQDINLDYEGFFVISASSGTVFPQYNYVNSFKVFDPTVVKMNHHFEDSHARRAEHDHYASGIAATISDLIHIGAVQEGEDFEQMTTDDLLELLAIQNFYLPTQFDYTHELLAQVAHHFQAIAANVNEVELYDHSVKLNEELFQTYFNMSIALAQELNYLEKKDDELEQILKQQVQEGDVAARNRRRRGSQQVQPMEVNNKETKRLLDSMQSFKTKLGQLNKNVEDMIAMQQKISKKIPIVERIQQENAEQWRVKTNDDRDAKMKLIKSKIDFKEVDDIFDDIVDEQLHSGVFFSTINCAMLLVIASSAYLWYKLNKADM